MRKNVKTLENRITVKESREGNIYRVLTYKGKQYTIPPTNGYLNIA